jgi:aspartate carbamoyltransferase catalytic subunit
LIYGLSRYNCKIHFVAPEPLQIQPKIEKDIIKRGIKFEKLSELSEVINKVDIVYISRLQEERFPNREDAKKFRGAYTLNPELLKDAKENMIILHHLPRLWEIPTIIDETPHAHYFQQEYNGLVVRCGILSLILGRAHN